MPPFWFKPRGYSVSPARSLHRCRGAVLIYGAFLLLCAGAGLMFLFNAHQLSDQKSALTNAADALALTAAGEYARLLNHEAYINRARVGNEVLIAHMVGLAAWARYTEAHANAILGIAPECVPPELEWIAARALVDYGLVYGLVCPATGSNVSETPRALVRAIPVAARVLAQAAEVQKAFLYAVGWAFRAEVLAGLSDRMDRIAQANSEPGQTLHHEWLPITDPTDSAVFSSPLTFTRLHEKQERGAMAELAQAAAQGDAFNAARQWSSRAVLPNPARGVFCLGRRSVVNRSGATYLNGFDQWVAYDVLGFTYPQQRSRRFRLPTCDDQYGQWISTSHFATHSEGADAGNASESNWTFYTGIPSFYELGENARAAGMQARLRSTVRVWVDQHALKLPGAQSALDRSDGIGLGPLNLPGQRMEQISSADTYFERPLGHPENERGAQQGQPYEKPNLFNPYWRARLVPTPRVVIEQAGLLQGRSP